MDLSNILQVGTQLFKQQIDRDNDGQMEMTEIAMALAGLFSNRQGNFDVASLINRMQGNTSNDSGGLMSKVRSWLSDGPNEPVQPAELTHLFTNEQIIAFAEKLGISRETALKGLAAAVPAIVDKSSSNGSLLDMVGGVSGAISLASKLFR